MMFTQIDHVGIAVRNMEESLKIYTESYGLKCALVETHEDIKTTIAFISIGESMVELLAPTDSEAPVLKFIEEKGEGVHHIAYRVNDIHKAVAELKRKGLKIMVEPRSGGRDSRIAFLAPDSSGSVLTELVQR